MSTASDTPGDDAPSSETPTTATPSLDRPFVPRRGTAMLLAGPPGSGKSFLAGRIAAEAHRAGHKVLYLGYLAAEAVRDGNTDPDIAFQVTSTDPSELEEAARQAETDGVELIVVDAIPGFEGGDDAYLARRLAEISGAQVIVITERWYQR